MLPPRVADAVVASLSSSSSSSSSDDGSGDGADDDDDDDDDDDGGYGTAAAVGCGAGFLLGSAVGFVVGLVSTEDTEEIVALLNPRSDTTAALKEASCRLELIDELHDEESLSPTAEREADTVKLTLHTEDNKERRSSTDCPGAARSLRLVVTVKSRIFATVIFNRLAIVAFSVVSWSLDGKDEVVIVNDTDTLAVSEVLGRGVGCREGTSDGRPVGASVGILVG